MTLYRATLVFGICLPVLALGSVPSQPEVISVVKKFLPPNTQLATLEAYDSQTGKAKTRRPAVLSGQLIRGSSNDVVFAYYSTIPDLGTKTLYVSVLHKTGTEYVKLCELSYYNRVLWVQDFKTVGLRLIQLPGDSVDSILVMSGIGASLGAQVQIFQWRDGLGLIDVMPHNNSVRSLSLKQEKGEFGIILSFSKYPGEPGTPPPVRYTWDGESFQKAQ